MIHGGDIYTDGVLKGRELLDFSSNINPLGPPSSFLKNINEAIFKMSRYPDIEYRELKSYLNKYTGVSMENFILGNGAAEIIDLVISCFNKVMILVPSFAEYELSCKKWGCEIEYSNLIEKNISGTLYSLEPDYYDIVKKINKVDAIIIGNPNNPDGNVINNENFKVILDYCENMGKTVIIDEAFIEFVYGEEQSFIESIVKYKCIFVIRAITKFFSMPGIRFGYGVTTDEILLKKIKEKQIPWNINSFAECAVKYSLSDSDFIYNSKVFMKNEREFMLNQLGQYDIIERVYKSNANYVLCKLRTIDSYELYSNCLKNDIVIRRCHNYVSLDEYYVRFAIKDRQSNLILLEALKGIK